MPECDRDHVDDSPDSLLLVRLLREAEIIAPVLGMTPGQWMHLRVDHMLEADRAPRGQLHVV